MSQRLDALLRYISNAQTPNQGIQLRRCAASANGRLSRA